MKEAGLGKYNIQQWVDLCTIKQCANNNRHEMEERPKTEWDITILNDVWCERVGKHSVGDVLEGANWEQWA